MHTRLKRFLHRALILCGLLVALEAVAVGPRVFSLDPDLLAQSKARLATNDAVLAPALAKLRTEADKTLKMKPLSVMDKARIPISRDKHDYMSQAPYFWPNPATSNGLPYVRRDGEVNPESNEDGDDGRMARMSSAAFTLALAHWFTGESPYAEKSASLMRAWFVDPVTRMNPNLNFGQAVPGAKAGGQSGLIESRVLIDVVDAAGLLEGTPAMTDDLREGLRAWFRDFTKWMLTSPLGLAESRAPNNHGTWYNAQVAAFALFIGDDAIARERIDQGRRLIAAQIQPTGRQPLELKRTRPFNYMVFNLEAFFSLAETGRRVGQDLHAFRTEDGRSIRAALDFAAPYLDPAKPWPFKDLDARTKPKWRLAELLRRASRIYGDPAYTKLLEDTKALSSGDRTELLWPKPGSN